jgi:hypothetical protein
MSKLGIIENAENFISLAVTLNHMAGINIVAAINIAFSFLLSGHNVYENNLVP